MSRYTSMAELLDELSPDLPASGAGWDDVLARADALAAAASNGSAGYLPPLELRRTPARREWRPSRLTIALALIALLTLAVAAAYALEHPIIDFGKAPRSSRAVVNVFGRETVFGNPTGLLPQQTRSITVVRIDGVDHRLSIEPAKKRGYFCYEWSGVTTDAAGHPIVVPPTCQGPNGTYAAPGGLLAMGRLGTNGTRSIIGGSFSARSATQLVLKYKDGTSDQIPFVWVTAPINAGFFLLGVPKAHQKRSDPPTSITLLDSANRRLETQKIFALPALPPIKPRFQLIRRHPQGYPPISVNVKAEWQKRRQLIRLTTNGVRTGLWVAPERGGGTCFWTHGFGDCSTPTDPLHPLPGDMSLKVKRLRHYVALCCRVPTDVQRLVAHFQDGDRTVLKITDGFVLWPIPKRHYPPGHRLNELVGYDNSGTVEGLLTHLANIRFLYPCPKPKNYGYGVVLCP